MPGFQSTRLVTEGALEPFFFLYTDDSIQGNPETCKQGSIMLNYEVKNNHHSSFPSLLAITISILINAVPKTSINLADIISTSLYLFTAAEMAACNKATAIVGIIFRNNIVLSSLP